MSDPIKYNFYDYGNDDGGGIIGDALGQSGDYTGTNNTIKSKKYIKKRKFHNSELVSIKQGEGKFLYKMYDHRIKWCREFLSYRFGPRKYRITLRRLISILLTLLITFLIFIFIFLLCKHEILLPCKNTALSTTKDLEIFNNSDTNNNHNNNTTITPTNPLNISATINQSTKVTPTNVTLEWCYEPFCLKQSSFVISNMAIDSKVYGKESGGLYNNTSGDNSKSVSVFFESRHREVSAALNHNKTNIIEPFYLPAHENAHPCKDFFEYTCGLYEYNNPIPPEDDFMNIMEEARILAMQILRIQLERPEPLLTYHHYPSDKDDGKFHTKIPKRHSVEVKLRNIYKNCVSQGEIDSERGKPLIRTILDVGGSWIFDERAEKIANDQFSPWNMGLPNLKSGKIPLKFFV